MVARLSMLASLIHWGLSLIIRGLFVRELAHRVKGMDYRAAGAAAYLGLGAVWAMGGRPRSVFDSTIVAGTIVAIDLLADPAQLGQLTVEMLDDQTAG